MEESFTKLASRGLYQPEETKPKAEFRKVTNFDELNERLAAYEARLSELESAMYKRVVEQRQNEAEFEQITKWHMGLVKNHDANMRSIEGEFDEAHVATKELRAHIDERHEDMRKGMHITWDAIEDLREFVDLLLLKVAPEQLEFRARVRKAFRPKDDIKD